MSSPLQEVPNDQSIEDVVGRPVTHLSAAKQATGEAIYCDDIPKYAGGVIALKLSSFTSDKVLTNFHLMNHKLLGNYLEKFNNKQLHFKAKASKLLDSAFYFVRRDVVIKDICERLQLTAVPVSLFFRRALLSSSFQQTCTCENLVSSSL